MKDTLTFRIFSVGIFLVGVILLFAYLLSVRAGIDFPPPMFWVSVIIIISSLVLQIISFASYSSFAKVIVVEILITNVALHLIYQIPYPGLYGISPYVDLAFTKYILDVGYFSFSWDPYPSFYILFAQLSHVTDLGLFSLAKYLPSLLDTALILMLYLFTKSILRNEKGALLATLLFVPLFHHIWVHSTYHYQVLGLSLAVASLYLYFSSKTRNNNISLMGLSIIFLIALIFTHHLTTFYLVTFLIAYLIISHILKVFFRKEAIGVTISFVSLTFVMLLSYWLYAQLFPLRAAVEFAEYFLLVGEFGKGIYGEMIGVTGASITGIQSVRGYILFYGFATFYAIFALIILYNLIFNARKLDTWYYHLSLVLFMWGILGFLTVYIVPRQYALIDDSRIFIYGWLLGFVPLVAGILRIKRQWLNRLGIGILACFMLFNIYMIDPPIWNPAAGYTGIALEEDFALAQTIDFSGTIGEYKTMQTLMAIYSSQMSYNPVTKGTLPDFYSLGDFRKYSAEDLAEPDWVIFSKAVMEYQKTLALRGERYYKNEKAKAMADSVWQLSESGYDGYRKRNKIYESRILEVFK